MDLFMIRRRTAWKTPAELEATAKRSAEVAESDFTGEIAWIRSYVVEEANGELGTVCIYQAASEDAARRHADAVGMPADEVLRIADTVIVRPDPEPAVAG
jgi:hypothetical protein